MTYGWKIIDSKGNIYTSRMQAARAMRDDPELTFESTEFDMAGRYYKDVTEEVRKFMLECLAPFS